MKRTHIYLVVAAAVAITGAALLNRFNTGGALPSMLEAVQIDALILTPIVFYGKVVDQFGNPVPGAAAQCKANNSPTGHGSAATRETNRDGAFSIHTHGAELSVSVEKSGYYLINSSLAGMTKSYGGFAYSSISGVAVHHPDKANPVIFTLYKKGEIEPLEILPLTKATIPRNGAAVTVSITSMNNLHRVELTIKEWIKEETKTSQGTFDWGFEIAAINGEIVERNNKYSFIAPETGYESSKIVSISGLQPTQRWEEMADRSYFIRFTDNTFARIEVSVASSEWLKHGSAQISGFLNPKVGSRILESDPQK